MFVKSTYTFLLLFLLSYVHPQQDTRCINKVDCLIHMLTQDLEYHIENIYTKEIQTQPPMLDVGLDSMILPYSPVILQVTTNLLAVDGIIYNLIYVSQYDKCKQLIRCADLNQQRVVESTLSRGTHEECTCGITRHIACCKPLYVKTINMQDVHQTYPRKHNARNMLRCTSWKRVPQ